MPEPVFKTSKDLAGKIDTYFNHHETNTQQAKDSKEPKSRGDKNAHPTITGLALLLGFSSKKAFEEYELNGRFARALKRGRLRIEEVYEKRLHQQSPAGAIFALKNLGWNDKSEDKTININSFKSIKIEIIETGPKPAETETEVVL